MKRIAENSYCISERLGDIEFKDKSMTQQHFAEEVDVNNIVDRALKTGFLGDPMAIANRQAIFGDFSVVGSYHDSLNKVIAAQAAFMELPVDVRNHFDNDPGKLLDFLGNPANLDEAVKLGLVVKKDAAPKGAEVPPATPVAPVPPVSG